MTYRNPFSFRAPTPMDMPAEKGAYARIQAIKAAKHTPPRQYEHLTYATDGKCHNANYGTFGHECGKPATWIGTSRTGFRSGYCDGCKEHGSEAASCEMWMRV